jgi:peroxiredoxin
MGDRDFRTLPRDLPAPVDDGAAGHLPGAEVPALTLESTTGATDLREATRGLTVLYVYPRTGVPGEPSPDGWDAIPGARGCTPQSCAFRDAVAAFGEHGAALLGLSAQTPRAQREFAAREHIPYPLLADPQLMLAAQLGLPTFAVDGMTLYKRLTLVIEHARVVHAFYPVFPPDRNAGEVLAWLASRP